MSVAKLIRIANEIRDLEKLALRPRPSLPKRKGKPTYKDYVERKKSEGERPLPKDMWESRQQGGRALTQPTYMEDEEEEALPKAAGKLRGPGKPDGTGPMKDSPECPHKEDDDE